MGLLLAGHAVRHSMRRKRPLLPSQPLRFTEVSNSTFPRRSRPQAQGGCSQLWPLQEQDWTWEDPSVLGLMPPSVQEEAKHFALVPDNSLGGTHTLKVPCLSSPPFPPWGHAQKGGVSRTWKSRSKQSPIPG